MATASPTPLGLDFGSYPQRPVPRQNARVQPSRPTLKRGSPLSSMQTVNDGPLPQAWKFSIGDSSDDDVPVPPMKFSAEAKAILGDEASVIERSSPSYRTAGRPNRIAKDEYRPAQRRSPAPLNPVLRDRTTSPHETRSGSPRIVRISGGAATIRRKAPLSKERGSPNGRHSRDLITPAPRSRNGPLLVSHLSLGSASTDPQEPLTAKPTSATGKESAELVTLSREHPNAMQETVAQMESLSVNRFKAEETGTQGSLRVKRVGKVTGRYLSGPARRGMKRRQSEEDQSPIQEDEVLSGGAHHVVAETEGDLKANAMETSSPHANSGQTVPPQLVPDSESHPAHLQRQANIAVGSPTHSDEKLSRPLKSTVPLKPNPIPVQASDQILNKVQPAFKVPPLPPILPSRFDQENEPPPTFRRNKINGLALSERPRVINIMDEKMLISTPVMISPPRQALATRSQNTPHRPAPPPPKMTVLETATATAGAASASQSRKKRNYISVNGKLFTRMDCIGRGGSSKVYRVMAENYKVFALKRVTLEDQDEAAIRGYKGEIDLLRRLENVERVVRLFDWEVNEERHTLSVLMEMGESDLNRVLTLRLNTEDAAFDVTFARYYWKEMLECVQAVHQHDIVHSDLKPANFLLLQGKLKLIDFGISNAIQDDTINVHREQHIGTPNYMSPEALVDSNAASGLPSSVGKIMKLGKPSDVWSLGCILYQMTYGKPPFAHIANQMQRIMAIPNPKHIIEFPTSGVGGILVSTGLVKTLRRCLNREPTQRPTVEQLLASKDSFLYPDSQVQDTVPVSQEMLARIQHNIINHIRKDGMPSEAELSTWPHHFFTSIKAAVEEGRA